MKEGQLRSKLMREERKSKRRELQLLCYEARSNRSPLQQLQSLDLRLGRGVGAVKERKRLRELIAKTAWPEA